MPLCAQNQTVTGLVVDVSGEPIIGATVMVVNGTVGTVTDIDGKFNIKDCSKKQIESFPLLDILHKLYPV